MTLNIGLKVKAPSRECTDAHCPFHGKLSVRGKLFDGKVTSNKAKQTITLQKESPILYEIQKICKKQKYNSCSCT